MNGKPQNPVLSPAFVVGSRWTIVGAITAVRRLGQVSFLALRSFEPEIQAVITGELQDRLRDCKPPFYASLGGTIRARPERDKRADTINGTVELLVDELAILGKGGRTVDPELETALELTAYLQRQGFADANLLARLFAPDYRDLLATPKALGAVQYLARAIGPCRWTLLTEEALYFGLCPGNVAGLKQTLNPADPGVDAILTRASWHEEPGIGGPSAAYAAIPLTRREAGPGADQFWTSRYSVAHLGSDLVAKAAASPKLDEAAVRGLEEAKARGEALIKIMSETKEPASTAAILRDLPKFDLDAAHTSRIFALFPSLEKRLSHISAEQQLELLWSILGHDHVKAVFTAPTAVATLARCVKEGMFGDFGALRALDPGTLSAITSLTRDFSDKDAIALVDQMFTASLSMAASACQLMAELDAVGESWRLCNAVARQGIASRVAFKAASTGVSPDAIVDWRNDLAVKLRHVFANAPIDDDACAAAGAEASRRFPWAREVLGQFAPADLTFDLVQLTFGNGLVTYMESASMFASAADCSSHWAEAAITFGGERWNQAEQRYELGDFWLYPAKNRPAILAKSCSGICSARNFELFHRPDHFQFTLVNPETISAAGSVQMYVHHDASGRPIWVVRGLNPSEKTEIEPLGFTLEILDALASLAAQNDVAALVCADGAGLFSADSSRLAVRAILRRLATTAARVDFASPLHIFDYHDRRISIEHGWRIWS